MRPLCYGLTEGEIVKEMEDPSRPELERVLRLAIRTMQSETVTPEKVRKRALRICRLVRLHARKNGMAW
jgi:hypothetical protein